MSRGFFNSSKDVDSEAEIDRRKSFIQRMEQKLEYKQSVVGSQIDEAR